MIMNPQRWYLLLFRDLYVFITSAQLTPPPGWSEMMKRLAAEHGPLEPPQGLRKTVNRRRGRRRRAVNAIPQKEHVHDANCPLQPPPPPPPDVDFNTPGPYHRHNAQCPENLSCHFEYILAPFGWSIMMKLNEFIYFIYLNKIHLL